MGAFGPGNRVSRNEGAQRRLEGDLCFTRRISYFDTGEGEGLLDRRLIPRTKKFAFIARLGIASRAFT